MIENEKILEELNIELYEKFPFYIPFEFIENNVILHELLEFIGFKINQNFVDQYVDELLYLDKDLNFNYLETFPSISNYNNIKAHKLEQNCSRLAELKDNLGKATFNNIFVKYKEQVIILTSICGTLIELYKTYPLEHIPVDPTFLFRQQKVIFQRHIDDINKIIIRKGELINVENFMETICNQFITTSLLDKEPEADIKEITKQPQKEKTIKPFRDFIIHSKNIEIEKLVKEHLSHLKGVSLRYLIEYFIAQNIILIDIKAELYNSISILFDGKNISKPNSIFGTKVFNVNDQKYWDTVIVFNKLFEKILPPLNIREFKV